MPPRRLPGMLALGLAMFGAAASAGDAPGDPLAGITVRRDVTYATAPSGPLTLDVYRPAGARAPSPVLLFFHGGGWIMGSKTRRAPEAIRRRRTASGRGRACCPICVAGSPW